MCVICAGVDSARPTRAELEQACKSNPDGFGWGAVVEMDGIRRLLTGRSMDVETAISSFETLTRGEVLAWFFHARIATHGSKKLENCHGFPVGTGGTVIAHNGILPLETTGDQTDSETFAREVFGGLFGGVAGLSKPHAWDVLEGFVEGSGSKVVILTVEDEMPLMILGEGLGHWSASEVWWSNSSYKPANQSYMPSSSAWGYEYDMFRSAPRKDSFEARWWLCDNPDCGARVADGESNCEFCGWCLDCVSAYDECMCLTVGGER